VDDLTPEQIREYRGTLKEPGKNSPYRDRSAEENLDLFMRMRNGEFEDGSRVLRAKIDMASPNMVMRDPTIYRIRRAHHHRTGDAWCIYPMYDFTHCISDSIEGITHSICTLEFENNRELYDWMLNTLELYHPQQIEFARLNLTHTVLSKRKLIQLVEEGHVSGWDDPRMPTLSGVRRRGITPEALREFCARIGVAKADSMVDYGLLEFCAREHLNRIAPRLMAVLDPVKVVIENYPEGQVEEFEMPLNPEDESQGTRMVPFSRELYIERDDFREQAPNKKFFRLAIGSAAALCLLHHLQRCGEGRTRQHNRTALHVRPRHPRRLVRRRTQGQRDPALGFRRPRRTGSGAPVRQAVHRGKSQCRRRRQNICGLSESRFTFRGDGLP
jgi:glutaminyl-tRNA synthetase